MPEHAFQPSAPTVALRALAEASAMPAPDSLNRAAFAFIVDRQLAACRRNGSSLVVLSLGLDGFDSIAPWYGQAVADRLLQSVWQRLRSRLRGSDLVVRIGEAEFGAVLLNAGAPAALSVDARIPHALSQPYGFEALEIVIAARTGTAVYPHAGTTGEALVSAAHRARSNKAATA
jgi:diguanylate cyclase (GGDEF)-like protein